MDVKQLFTDDEAVSPVIGVILMVAITVILAAVIGTFVLGLGDQVQSTAPQASFNFEFADVDGNSVYGVNATHDGGDTIDASTATLELISGGTVQATATDANFAAGDTIGSGDAAAAGAEARVVWTNANGDNSATLGKATAPN